MNSNRIKHSKSTSRLLSSRNKNQHKRHRLNKSTRLSIFKLVILCPVLIDIVRLTNRFKSTFLPSLAIF